jgi:hypothetical protein
MAVEPELRQDSLVSKRTEHDALSAWHVERLETLVLDSSQDFLRDFLSGFGLENDDHVLISVDRGQEKTRRVAAGL